MINYSRMQRVIEHSRAHKLGYISHRVGFDLSAVYLIYHPKTHEVIYIGETNSLYNRVNEHIKGIGRSSLRLKVRKRPELPQLILEYGIKYIAVDDYRERKFSEDILLGIYRPMLNYTR